MMSKELSNTFSLTWELSAADVTDGWVKIWARGHLAAVLAKGCLQFNELICRYRPLLRWKKHTPTQHPHFCTLNLLKHVISRARLRKFTYSHFVVFDKRSLLESECGKQPHKTLHLHSKLTLWGLSLFCLQQFCFQLSFFQHLQAHLIRKQKNKSFQLH